MKVRVLLFAALRERTGKGELFLDVPSGTTVGGLRKEVERDYPSISSVPVALAVNRQHANSEALLKDGDEVALLPPVSGG